MLLPQYILQQYSYFQARLHMCVSVRVPAGLRKAVTRRSGGLAGPGFSVFRNAPDLAFCCRSKLTIAVAVLADPTFPLICLPPFPLPAMPLCLPACLQTS
jgi:hypothetical protein